MIADFQDDALLVSSIINREILNKDTSTLKSCSLLKIKRKSIMTQAGTVHFVFLGLSDLPLPKKLRDKNQNISRLYVQDKLHK